MAKTRSMTRKQNDDDDNASRRKRVKTIGNSGVSPWPGLNNDVLFLVMMQLGVIDFFSFSGVCKSWRSFALSNRKMFMASRLPMSLWICDRLFKKECYLEDFEGRKFKTLIPYSADIQFIGLSCGYLIYVRIKFRDFWLVNPITRHQLHFPNFPPFVRLNTTIVKAILVFSPSISKWLLVVYHKCQNLISFTREGSAKWTLDSFDFCIRDIHVFKGSIYALSFGYHLCEIRLLPSLEYTFLETKNLSYEGMSFLLQEFVSTDENLYLLVRKPNTDLFRVQEFDFGEMKWVLLKEKTIGEYAFFISSLSYSAAIKPELWTDSQLLQYKRYLHTSRKGRFNHSDMWYFPHDCLNENLICR